MVASTVFAQQGRQPGCGVSFVDDGELCSRSLFKNDGSDTTPPPVEIPNLMVLGFLWRLR